MTIDDSLNYVEIAGQDWPLAPPEIAVGLVGDAMFQMTMADRIEEATRLERTWKRAVAMAEKRDQEAPAPPARLIELSNQVYVDGFRSAIAMLDLAGDDSDPDDERFTVDDFRNIVGTHYRAENNGPMTDADMNEILKLVTDAFVRRAEAATAIPPERSDASAPGRSSGRTAPGSKPKSAPSKGSRSRS